MRNSVLKILAGILALCTVACVLFILFEDPLENEFSVQVVQTFGIVLVFAIPILLCAKAGDNYKVISDVGIIFSVAACILYLLISWEVITVNYYDYSSMEFIGKLLLILCLGSFSLGHICFLLSNDSYEKYVSTVRNITIGLSVFMDLVILYAIFSDFSGINLDSKVLSIAVLLILSGTILTPLLNRISEES